MKRQAPHHAAGLVSLVVNKPDAKLLQDFLVQKFALSRRTAKAVIDGRSVWVNHACVWMARHTLKTGDKVEIPSAVVKGAQKQSASSIGSAAVSRGTTPTKRHVRVLWQDEAYLVCDKPAGLVTCDDPKSVEAILRVQEKIPTLEAVHRLDRDTTGCLLFAKNHAALKAAIELFKTHKVTKVYRAIALGRFPYAHLKIEKPLDGERAVSQVVREAMGPDASFLKVKIDTGRTNQIRRHLASVRAPILGDRVFGLKSARDPRLMRVPRQMLHAATLELLHPLDLHTKITVHSPLPADFRSTLRLFDMGK